MSASRHLFFDRPALYAALDEQRRARDLTWAQVAGEVRLAASTLTATARHGRMDSQAMLLMCRWLNCAPERFIRDLDGNPVDEPPPLDSRPRRIDTKKLYAALDTRRCERNLTWNEVAAELGPFIAAPALTRLAKDGRIGIHTMVAAVGWLGETVGAFTCPV